MNENAELSDDEIGFNFLKHYFGNTQQSLGLRRLAGTRELRASHKQVFSCRSATSNDLENWKVKAAFQGEEQGELV